MAYSAIFFDIDGTLVDSNDMHVLAWEEAFAGIDVRFERHEIHDQIGKGADMLIPALLPSAGEAEQKKLGDAQGAAFKARFLDRVSPFADAHALLARAARRRATNPADYIRHRKCWASRPATRRRSIRRRRISLMCVDQQSPLPVSM